MITPWSELLGSLVEGRDLSREVTARAMTEVLNGDADPVALGALLMGLRVKGESDDEILGFADAMLAAAEPLTVPQGTVDIVGTGGSAHRRSFALNVSSMASFVAASAGVTICKHGNVAASSTSGSFDFLAAIGVDIDKTPAQVEQQLANHGLAFAWAKTFHPAMRHAGPVRTSLGISTVFNILGPLVHPGGVKRIVMGVATETRAEQLARVLFERGMIRAWVIAGFDGLDELSTAGPNRVFEVTRHDIREMTIHPEAAGIDLVATASLAGGTAADNARIFTAMIKSAGGVDAAEDIVALNAAAALVVAEIEPDLGTAVASARRALRSGQVKALYDEFITGD